MTTATPHGTKAHGARIDATQLRQASWAALAKLNPPQAARSPVMFVVLVGAAVTAWLAFAGGPSDPAPSLPSNPTPG